MSTRRNFFAQVGAAAVASRVLPEAAYAQRAAVKGSLAKDMVWLNANENPAGPPQCSLDAMKAVMASSGRYHYNEFEEIAATVAQSEGLGAENVVLGCGSSEVLHTAVDLFTSPTRPLITVSPAYEGPRDAARNLGHAVVLTNLRDDYTADVRKMAEEADKAHGGLIYLCNPNNPTSAVTNAQDVDWLVSHLPANTMLLVDEAYLHFVERPDVKSAIPYVKQGKPVMVARTFSKIYGMAGLRVGFMAARPDIAEQLRRMSLNVISIVSARAVVAALADRDNILHARKTALVKTRGDLTAWLHDRGVKFIQPNANFLMIDTGRNAKEFIAKMPALGVAPGRPFPPLDNMLRVSIGTDADMAKFREVFWKVYKG
ncbi:MAG TPA: aminotransferase class I/II-fold pyridoxal phosphate-dependent enzyme [Candidatus Sulfopaludibacter sp.]|jgi:histidinol-phosphate aminotransferase|nr:aminotransferase class I/II-fold pyridoxal phosphate-dependent enzyme [Candidatus Sulfopaludibacter sp.]